MARKNPWFRFYAETIHDPKIRNADVAVRWLWSALLCVASQSPDPGHLTAVHGVPLTIAQLADAANLPVRTTGKGLRYLVASGCIDEDLDSGEMVIAKWDERQFKSDSSTQRSQQWREKQRQT